MMICLENNYTIGGGFIFFKFLPLGRRSNFTSIFYCRKREIQPVPRSTEDPTMTEFEKYMQDGGVGGVFNDAQNDLRNMGDERNMT